MESVERPVTQSNISHELMNRIKSRRDAETYREAYEVDATERNALLAQVKKREDEKAVRNAVEMTTTLDSVQLIIAKYETHKARKLPIAPVFQDECVTYLEVLQKVYEKCIIETEDSVETKKEKQNIRSRALNLITCTIELLVLYTRPSETWSRKKLVRMLRERPVKSRLPHNVHVQVLSTLFPGGPKIIPIK